MFGWLVKLRVLSFDAVQNHFGCVGSCIGLTLTTNCMTHDSFVDIDWLSTTPGEAHLPFCFSESALLGLSDATLGTRFSFFSPTLNSFDNKIQPTV
jgi:hypothetical protein